MTDTITLTPRAARSLVFNALTGAGTSPENARYFTDGIVDTELSGLSGHGFFWVPYYCEHVKSGKVDGKAKPKVTRLSASAFRVDARHGFAHPAIEQGFEKLIPAAKNNAIAAMAVYNSYNAATLGFHTGFLARQGLIAFGFTNSPPSIAPPGGRKPLIGTNPLSFAVPGGRNKIAFLIDQSSSTVAKSAVMKAAAEGRDIPLGWALDAQGKPTTDSRKALEGSMAPSGGYKGFGQGLIVEVLSAAVSGALLGTQMASNSPSITSKHSFIMASPLSLRTTLPSMICTMYSPAGIGEKPPRSDVSTSSRFTPPRTSERSSSLIMVDHSAAWAAGAAVLGKWGARTA